MDKIKEIARLYAEKQMPENWDRKDGIYIAAFYNHYADKLLSLIRAAHDAGFTEGYIQGVDTFTSNGKTRPQAQKAWDNFLNNQL